MNSLTRLVGLERVPAIRERALVRRLDWAILFAAVLCCVIVVIAGGPAYVADAYPLPDAWAPLS